MHSERLRLVAGREHDAHADDHRPPAQPRVVALLDGREERVQVGVQYRGFRGHEHMFASASDGERRVNAGRVSRTRRRPALTAIDAVNAAHPRGFRGLAALRAYFAVNAARPAETRPDQRCRAHATRGDAQARMATRRAAGSSEASTAAPAAPSSSSPATYGAAD